MGRRDRFTRSKYRDYTNLRSVYAENIFFVCVLKTCNHFVNGTNSCWNYQIFHEPFSHRFGDVGVFPRAETVTENFFKSYQMYKKMNRNLKKKKKKLKLKKKKKKKKKKS